MINIPDNIKEMLNGDNVKKNVMITFKDSSYQDITNENIVADSFYFTESICSKNDIKFGLCESPYIEFETYGIGKCKGAEFDCYIEMNATIHEKVSRDASYLFSAIEADDRSIFTCKIPDVANVASIKLITLMDGEIPLILTGHIRDDGIFYAVYQVEWIESYNYKTSYGMVNSIRIEFSTTPADPVIVKYEYFKTYDYQIPLGTYIVDSCKKQADMAHRKIIAYASNQIKSISFSDKAMNSNVLSTNKNFTYDVAQRACTYIENANESDFTSENVTLANATGSAEVLRYGDYRYYINTNDSLTSDLVASRDLYLFECTPAGNKKAIAEEMLTALINDLTIKQIPYDYEIVKYIVESTVITTASFTVGSYGYTSSSDSFMVAPYVQNGSNSYIRINRTASLVCETGGYNGAYDYLYSDTMYTNVKCKKISHPFFKMFYATDKRSKDWNNEYVRVNTWASDDGRKYLEAFIELQGKIGRINRAGKLCIVSLKDKFSALYPSETLYPADDLYPNANEGDLIYSSNYKRMWFDDDYTLPIGAVEVNYNNGTETIYTKVYADGYSANTDPDTYTTYDLSSNKLIKGGTISDANMRTVLNTFLANASGISYMPAEITMKGRPDIEAGDVLEVNTSQGSIVTMVLQRTISGIQNLSDSMRST